METDLTSDGGVDRYRTTHLRTERMPQLFDLRKDPHEKIKGPTGEGLGEDLPGHDALDICQAEIATRIVVG